MNKLPQPKPRLVSNQDIMKNNLIRLSSRDQRNLKMSIINVRNNKSLVSKSAVNLNSTFE